MLPQGTKIHSLYELSSHLQESIITAFPSVVWVKAEIMKVNHYPKSGHAYPDLVEKKDGKIIAQMRSLIWRDDFVGIQNKLQSQAGVELKDGVIALLCCRVLYDTLYGLSLRIIDVEPSLTIGELEKERLATIARLNQEGLFERNRGQFFPSLPKRIAIISVSTSKGYSDFMNVLCVGEKQGYRVFTHLFPSILQGDNAINSLIEAFEVIGQVREHFDAVAIIRGGGGDIGLTCYNKYELASQIATFPLPVLTGIGHATNQTVCDMVAYAQFITPTDLADFIISRYRNIDNEISSLKEKLLATIPQRLKQETQTMEQLENTLKLLDPKALLKKGYSMTFHNGSSLTQAAQVKEGEQITTWLSQGKVISKVIKIEQ
jgi:Exonuclease VII, large subunit